MTPQPQRLEISVLATMGTAFLPLTVSRNSVIGLQITPVMITPAQAVEVAKPKRGLSRTDRARLIQASPERVAALKVGRERLSRAMEYQNDGVVTLATLRLRAGLSQAELAGRIGMLQPNIARMEKKPGDLPLSTLSLLSKAFDVTIDEIAQAVQATASRSKVSHG